MRLLDGKTGPWPGYVVTPPPEIQVEASREIVRLQGEVTRLLLYLQEKKLFVEYVNWANARTQKSGQ